MGQGGLPSQAVRKKKKKKSRDSEAELPTAQRAAQREMRLAGGLFLGPAVSFAAVILAALLLSATSATVTFYYVDCAHGSDGAGKIAASVAWVSFRFMAAM